MKTILLSLVLCISIQGIAQKDTVPFADRFTLLPVPHRPDFSISPDYPTIRMSNADSKWHNMLGGNVPLVEYNQSGHKGVIATSGYVELHNVAEDQLMSWQLWRGNLGLDFYYYPRLRSQQHSLRLGALFHHESQHVTDMDWYAFIYLKNPALFQNASARSFEYQALDIKHEWMLKRVPVMLYNRVMVRTFSEPMLDSATRQMLSSFTIESGIRVRIEDGFWVYTQGYYESIRNNFVAAESPYIGNWNKQPFKYLYGEVGVWLTPNRNSRSMNFYLT
ncbi:MAG TPA: hypothetical protein VEC12_09030 [Bacteroidia bacterium]|nr:hypothetical protein [Bacteroidia bacterium]